MANGAPVMVWTAKTDMSTNFYNTTVLPVSGLSLDELLNDGWLQRVHPDDLDSCMRSYVPAFSARKPIPDGVSTSAVPTARTAGCSTPACRDTRRDQ